MREFNVSRSVRKARRLLLVGVIVSIVLFPTAVGATATDTNTGLVTSISKISDSEFKTVVYCSPSASASGSGTSNSPMTLAAALNLSKTTDGIAILLTDGTYSFGSQITIPYGNNGSASAYKVLKAVQGANVTFDFSSQVYSTGARGLQLEGNYWYVEGITLKGAADNGMYLAGNNNVIERCIFQANRDSGLQVSHRDSATNIADWPSNNYIINCTAFDNDDPSTHENADGFAAKLTCGNGNVFDGCISYCNIDDGWDLYAKVETGSIGVVTIRNCVSFNNGTKTNGTSSTSGDRNGFKLGGSDGAVRTAHTVFNCLSFNNGKDGFTDNGNGGALSISNCTSYNNTGTNLNFYRSLDGGVFSNLLSVAGKSTDKFLGTIDNSVYYNSSTYYKVQAATAVTSGAKIGSVISAPSASDFASMTAPIISSNIDSQLRNADGTITTNGFLVTNGANFSGMGAKFGVSTRTLNINVSVGDGTPTVPTVAPTVAQTQAVVQAATQTATTAKTTSSDGTTVAVHSDAQVVSSSSIVQSEKVAELLKTTMDNPAVNVVTDKATTLDSSVFSEIVGKDKTIKVDIVDTENKIIYSWSFDGKTISSSKLTADTILDLSISFDIDKDKQQAVEKLTNNKNAFYLSFTQHGELPGPATMMAYVGNVFADGTSLSLNFYNEETNKIELINEGLIVTNGYVEYTITHCSTYFLTQKIATADVSVTGGVVTNAQAVEVSDNGTTLSDKEGGIPFLGVVLVVVFAMLVVGGILIYILMKRKGSKEEKDIIETKTKTDTNIDIETGTDSDTDIDIDIDIDIETNTDADIGTSIYTENEGKNK